jgi:hypothetical protein
LQAVQAIEPRVDTPRIPNHGHVQTGQAGFRY